MRSRLGMSAYYKKRRVGGRTSHLTPSDIYYTLVLSFSLSLSLAHALFSSLSRT